MAGFQDQFALMGINTVIMKQLQEVQKLVHKERKTTMKGLRFPTNFVKKLFNKHLIK